MTEPSIVIAVLTYRRPDDLERLLTELIVHVASSSTPRASILVVDNDARPTAQPVVAQFSAVRYVHEPRPGIAAARNRALDEVESEDLLIFIDDDERPRDRWLDLLVTTWKQTRPAAVVGPVVSAFATPPDPWIEAGRFFTRLRHPTGTEVRMAATNNLLLDLAVIRSQGIRFDDRFGTSGGSDTLFTRALVRGGGRIVWCDEAIVTDVVPPERMTRAWVLRRSMRMGNSSARVTVLLVPRGHRRWWARATLVVQGLGRVVLGGARSMFGRVTGSRTHHARGARMLARGRGISSGALGRIVAEYGRGAADEMDAAPS